ncbi:cobalt-precorrin-5B (C(1))-methyltransferase CbiD [Planktothrix agardhii]|jgi:cobalt-precorrin-5B (C1)-methyltransferase|uniref:cobalt-precorrin-5B (C(1))-methyltransferase CbiD n=2 Tax=Planktothrix agardhii TaxID=1160 RepID=UPI001D09F1ED|nr:cobalt-precorrin-5B (C(1))-methyltransferase CbiD [Planktothrix agardhii]MCB8788827.1 cobalt-precorrin-5B (C(1))-methyltransferase CbiD [Planktothrix agardhii 1025]MCF3613385.1 cobalt-precorrin-5B (C(1))-methyltransferase CbiD [Planktothrix agardhii 1027]MCF3613627.1 cobalt-precorrin-5B (C(1))-methyltransferase CbiD [Planktothrix agardhii 1027]MCF3644999.1 cobalt-precorrin-5B (C(1))-methyltransferase CbiD [Planktothrix agardhii 1026]CAD5965911.1 Cobalt-precorrin-5B C(1)-methyltransferase [P
MTTNQPRSGYTLPVFACAAAMAALEYLQTRNQSIEQVSIDLINPAETVNILIEQIAILTDNSALAITRSDPGDNLDLTRNTPIWAMVEWWDSSEPPPTPPCQGGAKEQSSPPYQGGARGGQLSDTIFIKGGEGIGYDQKTGQTAIYRYAKTLLLANIEKILPPNKSILITFILPQGKRLATRTSNAAFGIVEGLSLLGTTGISQPLTVPEQLEQYKIQLQEKAKKFDSLVFCIGENGLELAAKMGISPHQMIKTANWLGPMLVCASLAEVKSILLFGYHGKLIKLAGGIFHTHHHIADGRLEILTAHCANLGLPTFDLQKVFNCSTAEDALQYLRELDAIKGENWVIRVYGEITKTIDQRSQNYIYTHCEKNIKVGSVMFDRQRKIIIKSENADIILG